jgi:hypothetical protein
MRADFSAGEIDGGGELSSKLGAFVGVCLAAVCVSPLGASDTEAAQYDQNATPTMATAKKMTPLRPAFMIKREARVLHPSLCFLS